MNSFKFRVPQDNIFNRYILYVTFWSVHLTVLYDIHNLCEFYLLMEPL